MLSPTGCMLMAFGLYFGTGNSLRHDKSHHPRAISPHLDRRRSSPFTSKLAQEDAPCHTVQTTIITVTLIAGPIADTPVPTSRKTTRITKTATVYQNITNSSSPSSPFPSSSSISLSQISLGPTLSKSASLESESVDSESTKSAPSIASSSTRVSSERTGIPLASTSQSNPASQPSPNPSGTCPDSFTKPMAYSPEFSNYFGFNMVNTKPYDFTNNNLAIVRTSDDWLQGIKNLKAQFPNMTAIRQYSTTDGTVKHLLNAMPHVRLEHLKILVGVWASNSERFNTELSALSEVIDQYGCADILAVSVGNEDLLAFTLAHGSDAKINYKSLVADFISRIKQTRSMLRSRGCCNVPVTHTDVVDELMGEETRPLLAAVDHAIIANIFPYWSNVSANRALNTMSQTAFHISNYTQTEFNKAVWLGETGSATSDAGNHNPAMQPEMLMQTAQQYWREVGCRIMEGKGTAFYYVDWDEDNANSHERPEFGVLQHNGEPKFDLTCKGKSKLIDMGNVPSWLGGNGW